MSEKVVNDDTIKTDIEPILPPFGLAIAQEKPSLQLCKPKLLPLKTYSYLRMEIQARNKLDRELASKSTNQPH